MLRAAITALAVLFAMPSFAIQLDRFNPLDFDVSEITANGKYLTYRVADGPCTKSPAEFREHAEAIAVFGMPRFTNALGEVIIPLVGYDDAYAEGWKLENDEACLIYITVLAGEAV